MVNQDFVYDKQKIEMIYFLKIVWQCLFIAILRFYDFKQKEVVQKSFDKNMQIKNSLIVEIKYGSYKLCAEKERFSSVSNCLKR